MAMTPDQSSQDESESYSPLARKFLWADSMKSVDKLIIGLAVLCALLFLMEFLWHRHTKVPGEQLIGFYPLAGFISFSLIVLGAKALRVFIARDESFYAPHGVDAEEYPLDGTERIPMASIVVARRPCPSASRHAQLRDRCSRCVVSRRF